jgi:hypothetical protein
MDVMLGILGFISSGIEQILRYVETHHWVFGFLAALGFWISCCRIYTLPS